MKWITREHVRIDRIAIPWVVKHFIDSDAEFLFAPRAEVLQRAQAENAIPYDVEGAELAHRGAQCGLDAVIAKYNVTDPAVLKLADIVRGADVKAVKGHFPESAGLEAISHGFFLLNLPDLESLERQFPMYDALYRYCQDKVNATQPGPAAGQGANSSS